MIHMVGIILARGGSVRLPGKNIRPLCGRPMIEWTIIAACESKLDAVLLSSDSDEILDVARGHRVYRVKRPAELAGPAVDSYKPLRHAYEQWSLDVLSAAENVMLLQPTSPLRPYWDINRFLGVYKGQPMASVGTDGIQNGAIYAAPLDWLLNVKNTWDQPGIAAFYMPEERSVDVNGLSDFEEAEARMKTELMV